MAVTSTDVARHAGVSRSTVSYILNGHGQRFSRETRKLVEQAVAELNYSPHSAGRTLVRGHSDIVILVAPLAANSDFSHFVDILTARLYDDGLSLLIRSATASVESFTTVISAVQPRAVLAFAALSKEEKDVLDQAGVRVLEIARLASRRGGLNDTVGAYQVDHLIERGFSPIRFVRLGPRGRNLLQDARERGVRQRCVESGIECGAPLVVDPFAQADPRVLADLPPRTGLACYNDDVAVAVLSLAEETQIAIPAELGIIGVDNSVIATRSSPHLTTVGFDPGLFYRTALDVITGKTMPGAAHISADVYVVPGGTT